MHQPTVSGCVVITGSTKGIGFNLASAFLQRGQAVFICGRSEEQLNVALNKLKMMFPSDLIDGCTCDLQRPIEIENLWYKAVQRFGSVNIWINNAGASTPALNVTEISNQDIMLCVQTNILGTMLGSKIALQGMLKQGYGQLFNMEGWGSRGEWSSGMTIYGSTKRTVSYFSDALYKENKSTPIQIGTLSPGMVATDLLIDSWQNGNAKNWHKMKRIFMFVIDPPETVCDFLAEKILKNKKTHVRIVWMTPWRLLKRFFQPYYWRRNPIKSTALDKI